MLIKRQEIRWCSVIKVVTDNFPAKSGKIEENQERDEGKYQTNEEYIYENKDTIEEKKTHQLTRNMTKTKASHFCNKL